jgi:hypothetical protein
LLTPSERYNTNDEKAYKSFLPVYFPPTHRDLEDVEVDPFKDLDFLSSQLRETYEQTESVAEGLVIFSENVADFPKTILSELTAIASILRSLASLSISPQKQIENLTKRTIEDINLICSVLLSVSGGITEIMEQAKHARNFSGPTRKTIWDEYSFHMLQSQGLDLNTLLEICQDFVQCLEDIIKRYVEK